MLIVSRITADLSLAQLLAFFSLSPSIESLSETAESKKWVVSVRLQHLTCHMHKDPFWEGGWKSSLITTFRQTRSPHGSSLSLKSLFWSLGLHDLWHESCGHVHCSAQCWKRAAKSRFKTSCQDFWLKQNFAFPKDAGSPVDCFGLSFCYLPFILQPAVKKKNNFYADDTL